MFQTRTSRISAALLLIAFSAQPMAAHADQPAPQTVPAQAQAQSKAQTQDHSLAYSLDALRDETKIKLSETQEWVKDTGIQRKIKTAANEVEYAVDELQDSVTPAGRSLKAKIKKGLPGSALARLADRTVTVFGLILMLSFALVVFLMGIANPMSRLGGRH